jgi:MerR family transcriptional regulator, light-induced transcriptional regulator
MAHVVEHVVPDTLNSTYKTDGATAAPADILQLVEAFISSPPGQFIDELERLGLNDLPFAVFYRDLIKPIACTLGDMWSEDTAGFLGVSIAIERLRLAVDMLYPDDDFALRANAKRVLISCFENGRHDFGAFLLGKAFSYSNWLVDSREWNVPVGSPMSFLAREHYDMFALSVGAPFDVKAVAAAIASVRTKTMNPHLVVALGGVGPALDPEAFAMCGADFISKDVFDAVAKAEATSMQRAFA